MRSVDFCYWLQGHFELNGYNALTKEQVEMIGKHLNLVFLHEIDPSYGDEKHQEELNNIHNENLQLKPGSIMRC
jgi:hypothetical protein